MSRLNFNVFFNSFWHLSGGDRIIVECSKRWAKEDVAITFYTVQRGLEFCKSYTLDVNYEVLLSSKADRFGFLPSYFARTVCGCLKAMFGKFSFNNKDSVVVYSASDFWPDSLPAWILKMRFKNVYWIAGFYLFASSPLSKDSPYKGKLFPKGLFYYLSQKPVCRLIKKHASMVWVTSEPDRHKFTSSGQLNNDTVLAIRGGVDTKTPSTIPESKHKLFDAVFIGRFHPQKGVLELVDIWQLVCQKQKSAKLAIIGVGDLENGLRKKIRDSGLEPNITLFGFKDGVDKLKIFKDSRIVVHPAIYDSGGMAACEAMACGLPGVSFDLPALATYYPKGMLKTTCFDLKAFADNVLNLLNDKELYRKTSQDALDWSKEWDWDKRAKELLECLKIGVTK